MAQKKKLITAKNVFTECWSAEKFADEYQWKARWIPEWKKWIVWREKEGVWREDDSGEVSRLAVGCVRGWQDLRREIQTQDDEFWNARLNDWMFKGESHSKLQAMVDLAKPYMITSVKELDGQLWKLNIKNKVIDFKNGSFGDHDPKDLMTKIAPVSYEEGEFKSEMCHKYLQFLNEIMLGRQDLKDYLQKVFGSCMVGKILDRAFYVWIGTGRNGKTTLANVWMGCLGEDYAVKLPFHTFTKPKFDDKRGVTPELDNLRGARLAMASEGEDNERLATSRVKELTGKTPISVNPKYKNQYSYIPEATIVLETNKMPAFDGSDIAVMDRLKVFPFDLRIEDKDVNLRLDEELEGERDGIFHWGIQGCLRWQEEGMDDLPESMVVAIELQRQENDAIGLFLTSGILRGKKGAETPTQKMIVAFMKFCENFGVNKVSPRTFKRNILSPVRFIDELEIKRLNKIEGIKGGGYLNVEIVDELDVEGETKDMGTEFKESYGKQGKMKFEKAKDEDWDNAF